jgi:UDP-N-acetylmuramoyl-L-alanyl-D-glutamate--2,6-diaminopimelate ligase
MMTATLFAGQALRPATQPAHHNNDQLPTQVQGITRDSRLIKAGDAFVVCGAPEQQAAHVSEAIARGASIIVHEKHNNGAALPINNCSSLFTSHARWSYARASARLRGADKVHFPLIGVTGTAGKSTITHHAWWMLGEGAARMGTIGFHDGVRERVNPQTTPPPEEMHDFLRQLPSGCPGVAMELSSHAGDQYRLAGLRYDGLVFTGLGHDHLDYHRTTGAYFAAKLRLLRLLKPGGICVINADNFTALTVAHAAHAVGAQVILLGLQRGESRVIPDNGQWALRHHKVVYPLAHKLPGDFNAWNAAAAALVTSAAGISVATAIGRLATMPSVPGRLELLARQPDTYVDYAHTPDEISTMLHALRRAFPLQRIVCVFGCGGDRDRSKRGPMGCAALIADQAVLTTDNCRSEDPQRIAHDVIAGLPSEVKIFWAKGDDFASGRWLGDLMPTYHYNKPGRVQEQPRSLIVELDRGQAIRLARSLAGDDGIVVIAGKGHETTQIIGHDTMAWDDRAFVRNLTGGLP